MSRPLLVLATALAAGAWAGQESTPAQAWSLLLLAATVLGLVLAAPLPAARHGLLAATVALGAAAAGVERAAYDRAPLRRWVTGEPATEGVVEFEGVALRDSRPRGDRTLITLEVEHVRAAGVRRHLPGRVRLEVAGEHAGSLQVLQGERLRVWAQPSLPRGWLTPGAFDPTAHAFREGVHAHGHCKSALLVSRGAGLTGWPWTRAAARVRQWARGRFEALVLPGPERALLRAMVLGDRSELDTETAEAFRAAGTYHVLAISGAQVALLAAVLVAVSRRLRVAPGASAVTVCATLAFYAQLVGGDVPVVRAALMAAVLIAGRALSLEADAANLLGLAAALLLALRPSTIGDLGFQLSFAATLGILLLTPPLLAGVRAQPLRLDLALAGSVAAQLALMPLLAAHFHRFSPAALVLNLAAVPLSGAVLLGGLLVLASSATLAPLAPLAADLAWCTAHALLRSADLVRLVPALDVRVPPAPPWAVALHAWALLVLVRTGRRKAAVPMAVSLLALSFGRPALADGRLHVSVLDVGQGDAIVLRGPSGRVWVVDAGPAYGRGTDLGEVVVAPYLRCSGARRLDRLLVTHAHPDHAGGAGFLLRNFRVGESWEGPAPRDDRVYRAFADAHAGSGAWRRTVLRGVSEEWDGVQVRVLSPPAPMRPRRRAVNDDSVVLWLRYGVTAMLLAGDLEHNGEAALPPARAAVLKVPHHGSRSSSSPSFVAAVAPRVAVVSAGFHNRYGHPHAEVVQRYRTSGAELLRTDVDGTVTLSSDGRRIWVRTFREPRERRVQ